MNLQNFYDTTVLNYSKVVKILEENIDKSDYEIKELLRSKNIFLKNEEMLSKFQCSRKVVCYILDIMNMNTSAKFYDSAFKESINRDLQVLNMIFNYETMKGYNYFGILLKAVDYYGKAEYLSILDKKGTLLSKIKNIKKQISLEVLKDEYIPILEYMFPELFKTASIPKTNY